MAICTRFAFRHQHQFSNLLQLLGCTFEIYFTKFSDGPVKLGMICEKYRSASLYLARANSRTVAKEIIVSYSRLGSINNNRLSQSPSGIPRHLMRALSMQTGLGSGLKILPKPVKTLSHAIIFNYPEFLQLLSFHRGQCTSTQRMGAPDILLER